MAHEQFADLSGSGFQPFSTVGQWTFGRVFVSETGPGHTVDVTNNPRWVDLGFWAFYEVIPDGLGLPVGNAMGPVHWINWQYEGVADDHAVNSNGVDGFYYSLKEGVLATFDFYTP